MDESRRDFLRILTGAVKIAFLFACGIPAEARYRTLAEFLDNFDAIYDPNQEWEFGSGRLLCGINGQMGNLLIYVDDVWVPHSVDSVTFDPNRQRVRIMCDNQSIFSYDPRLRTSPYRLH